MSLNTGSIADRRAKIEKLKNDKHLRDQERL